MFSAWLTWFFSSVWRLLLRLEDFLERSLLRLVSLPIYIRPIWLAALFLQCASSTGLAALAIAADHGSPLSEWSLCAGLGALAGAGPTVIVLICLSLRPARFARWIVVIGSAASCVIARGLLYVFAQAMAATA
jgi:hypothetical protein